MQAKEREVMNNSNVEVLKGSEIVIRCLERHDVDVVFAYPGGQTIELHQALTHSKKIRQTKNAPGGNDPQQARFLFFLYSKK